MTEIETTLRERGDRYGEFETQAMISQDLKGIFRGTTCWFELEDYQKECLDMVANKIGRILNGDVMYLDSWYDCQGYFALVVKELEK